MAHSGIFPALLLGAFPVHGGRSPGVARIGVADCAPEAGRAAAGAGVVSRRGGGGTVWGDPPPPLAPPPPPGGAPGGTRLPAGGEPAPRLEVSRMTLREAIRALQGAGLVESRRGRHGGTFVVEGLGLPTADLPRPVGHAVAGRVEAPPHIVGILACRILPYSGINLLIHSVRQIRCEFTPRDGGPVERYKGETGIGFGIDVNVGKHTSIRYSVLAHRFRPGTHQLAGKYSGWGGHVTFGLSVGNTVPIAKRDGSISLQPIGGKRSGGGVAAGFTYLYLEADK